MINYEIMTEHFTAQRCLFGCNSILFFFKKPNFSHSVRACMGMRLRKKMSQQCLHAESS